MNEKIIKAYADIVIAVQDLTPVEALGIFEVLKYGLLKSTDDVSKKEQK